MVNFGAVVIVTHASLLTPAFVFCSANEGYKYWNGYEMLEWE